MSKLLKTLLIVLLLVIASLWAYMTYLSASIEREPEKELGKAVLIEMPNGVTISTYEKYLKKENGRTYLTNDITKDVDVTDGELSYQ